MFYLFSGIFLLLLEFDLEDNVLICGFLEGVGEYLIMGLYGRDLWFVNNMYILWNLKEVF